MIIRGLNNSFSIQLEVINSNTFHVFLPRLRVFLPVGMAVQEAEVLVSSTDSLIVRACKGIQFAALLIFYGNFRRIQNVRANFSTLTVMHLARNFFCTVV